MSRLQNRVTIVTGATRGIGRGIAEVFASEGALVVLAGRNESVGNEIVQKIAASGGESLFVPADVTSPESVERLIDQAIENFGRIDILVPNAGILGLGSVTDVSMDSWYNTIDVNLNGVFYLLRFGIPKMQKRKSGNIIVIGSIASDKGFPNHAAYCASKGALPALVRQVAVDYAPEIRINLIQSGPVDTDLYRDSRFAFPNPETVLSEVPDDLPLNRIGTPHDIAEMALFLASEEAAWITGSVFTVDGGATATG